MTITIMDPTTFEDLTHEMKSVRDDLADRALEGFIWLSTFETGLYLIALSVLGDTYKGARWFSQSRPEFNGCTAWEMLADGQRGKVIAVLHAME